MSESLLKIHSAILEPILNIWTDRRTEEHAKNVYRPEFVIQFSFI